MVDKQKQAGQCLYICFLDLKSAYDRVSRPVLWQVLQRLGLHGNMLQAIQGLYGSATVAVKINGQQGLPLVSVSGVRQGCPLSPTLFGLLADGLHRFLQPAAAADGLAVGPDLMVTDLGYADSDKTVVMEMTGQQSAGGSWSCGGQALRQVSEVRYLGAIFQSGQGFLPSLARLQHRAQAAWAQLSRQYGTLQCEKGVWLMLQLYGACVLPAGSFGCELWGVWPLRGQFRKTPQHSVSWPP